MLSMIVEHENTRRKPTNPRRVKHPLDARFKLAWRRDGWSLQTSAKYRRFGTLADAVEYVRKLQAHERATGRLQARIEERDRRGRWREVPALARLWGDV